MYPFLQSLAFEPNSQVKFIGMRAFCRCSELSSIQIPQSVEVIKYGAFACCDKLSSVVFDAGSKLQTIGADAFYSCNSLAFMEIPASVKTIGARAFKECQHLRNIEFEPESPLTTIDHHTFANCYSLRSIIIPSTVTTIGPGAFHNCSSLTYVGISEGGNLSEIGDGAFAGCKNIVGIEIPSSVQKIGNGAFYGTKVELHMSANSIPIPANYTPQQRIEAIRTFVSYLFVNPERTDIHGDIPRLAEISPYSNGSVVWVGDDRWQLIDAATQAWQCPQGVISLRINTQENEIVVANPEKMQILDGNASFTVSLSGLDIIPSLVLWRSFGFSVNKVRTVIVPHGITTMRPNAFMNTDIRTVDLRASNLAKIEELAFKNCKELSSITLPKSVSIIKKGAFEGCTALKTVTFEAGCNLIEISKYAFKNCSSLENIQIPEGVERIGGEAFADCTSLTTITLPKSLRDAENIFLNCPKLTEVTWNITPTTYNEAFCTSLKRMLWLKPNCTVKLKDGTEFRCGDTGWYQSS
jgi:hypothetical protein